MSDKEKSLKSTIEHSCELCKKKFKTRGNLQRHFQSQHFEHPAEAKLKCTKCDRDFSGRPDNLKRHMQTKHAENKEHTRERIKKAQNQNDKLFYCPNSPTRSFKTQALFVQHMLNKHKDYSYGLNKPRTKRASKHDSDHTSSQHASKPENQETSKHDSSQTLIKTDPNIPYTKLDLSLPNIAKLKLL